MTISVALTAALVLNAVFATSGTTGSGTTDACSASSCTHDQVAAEGTHSRLASHTDTAVGPAKHVPREQHVDVAQDVGQIKADRSVERPSEGPAQVTDVKRGFVLFDGRDLRPPYRIEKTPNGILINDHSVPWESLGLSADLENRDTLEDGFVFALQDADAFNEIDDESFLASASSGVESFADELIQRRRMRTDRKRRGPFGRDHASRGPWYQLRRTATQEQPLQTSLDEQRDEAVDHVIQALCNNQLIVHLPDEPLLITETPSDVDNVLALLAPTLVGEAPVDETRLLADVIPLNASPERWETWQTSFTPSDVFAERVDNHFRGIETLLRDARVTRQAVMTVDQLTYPLTILGMLLSVGAFGHLLRSVPNQLENGAGEASERLQRATAVFVAIIAALSALDLTWTVLAAQAGTMRELNPLGAQLLHDPLTLSVFKIAATLLGCGILYSLRKSRRVADASWWLCLVMTAVTFRWVMFNSMFA